MPARRAVTLIELLVTMAIIAIIAAAILGTVSAAMESARRSRTQTLITRIDGLVSDRLASYEVRRVAPHPDFEIAINHNLPGPLRGQALADVRLLALRELMKYEMPDRWSDVLADPVILIASPTVTLRYRARFNSLKDDPTLRTRNQGAECLYLFVMNLTGDGEARTLFSEQDIGDTDEDGASEFVDGWGNPISWIRWPSHFNRTTLTAGLAGAAGDHDPFDMFRRDQPETAPGPNYAALAFPPGHPGVTDVDGIMTQEGQWLRDAIPAFRLKPLIYSSGPDGISDFNAGAAGDSIEEQVTQGLNPYHPEYKIGAAYDVNDDGDDNSIDNIHNHLQDY